MPRTSKSLQEWKEVPKSISDRCTVVWAPGTTLEEVERFTIFQCLRLFGGDRSAAARSLSIAVRTISNKLRTYKSQGFAVPRPPDPVQLGRDAWNYNPRNRSRKKSY